MLVSEYASAIETFLILILDWMVLYWMRSTVPAAGQPQLSEVAKGKRPVQGIRELSPEWLCLNDGPDLFEQPSDEAPSRSEGLPIGGPGANLPSIHGR
jgi:hypothetical protein